MRSHVSPAATDDRGADVLENDMRQLWTETEAGGSDTIHVPGVWLQAHHLETDYYRKFFSNGMTEAHLHHDEQWH